MVRVDAARVWSDAPQPRLWALRCELIRRPEKLSTSMHTGELTVFACTAAMPVGATLLGRRGQRRRRRRSEAAADQHPRNPRFIAAPDADRLIPGPWMLA